MPRTAQQWIREDSHVTARHKHCLPSLSCASEKHGVAKEEHRSVLSGDGEHGLAAQRNRTASESIALRGNRAAPQRTAIDWPSNATQWTCPALTRNRIATTRTATE